MASLGLISVYDMKPVISFNRRDSDLKYKWPTGDRYTDLSTNSVRSRGYTGCKPLYVCRIPIEYTIYAIRYTANEGSADISHRWHANLQMGNVRFFVPDTHVLCSEDLLYDREELLRLRNPDCFISRMTRRTMCYFNLLSFSSTSNSFTTLSSL